MPFSFVIMPVLQDKPFIINIFVHKLLDFKQIVYAAELLDKLSFEHENMQTQYNGSLHHFQRLRISKVLLEGGNGRSPNIKPMSSNP
jgi:hypothetical protein